MRDSQGLPEVVVTVGRRELTAGEAGTLVSVQVQALLGVPTQCELVFADTGGPRLEAEPGDALRVEVAGRRPVLFAGDVTAVERHYGADGARQVRLRGYDALHRLRKRQSVRLLSVRTLEDLATELVAGTGLSVAGRGTEIGPVYQCGESDLELLRRVCSRYGCHPVVRAGRLEFATLTGTGGPVPLELGTTLHSAELELSVEPAFRSATVAGWDTAPAASVAGEASSDRSRPAVAATAAPERVGGGGAAHRVNEPLDSDAAATELAQAMLDSRSAAEVVAELVAEGHPGLQPGARVRVRGVAADVEGLYTAVRVAHRIDRTGFETAVSSRPPAPPAERAGDAATLGRVTDTRDPEGRGRVRVELSAYPELASPWAPVLIAGAGPGKGAVVLPEAGDHVLVLLVAADPAHAIVLGGLYGTGQPPDAETPGPRGGRYTLRTADGQQVQLDADAHRLSLSDGHGSSVLLGPELLSITAATDLVLEAPGQTVRIRARTVEFEERP